MSVFQFSFSEVPAAISIITGFIQDNVILSAALFVSYALFYLYGIINNKAVDSDVYEVDLLGNGVSSAMVALLLIGLDESSKGFSLASLDFNSVRTKVALFLLIYAIVLLIFAFTKMLPKFLVVVFGNGELDLFINFISVLMIEPNIAITGTLLAVIGVPLLILLIIERLRRLAG